MVDSDRPAPHPSVDTAFLVDQAVLFDERNGQVHELNPSASAVWMLIDGQSTLDMVAADLQEILGVPADVVRPDLDGIVAQFADQGLLVGSERVVREDAHNHSHAHEPAGGSDAVLVMARPPDP